jgi:hypothetical protein
MLCEPTLPDGVLIVKLVLLLFELVIVALAPPIVTPVTVKRLVPLIEISTLLF